MLKAIKSKKAYEETLNRIYGLMQLDLKINTDDYNELEILSILVEDYENKSFPISLPDPIEAIKFRMEQMGIKKSDLAEIIGYKSRVSEILNKKRKLTLQMIRNLHEKLHIPYESLIADY